MSNGTPPIPKVDEQFWFDMSADMIKGSVERLDQAAEKVKNMIAWAYGIYTASSLFTVEFKKIHEWWLLAILLAPYLLLILAYWYSQVSQIPITIEFDARSPTDIQRAYVNSYQSKKKELGSLRILSFMALSVLSLSLITAFVLKNGQKDEIFLSIAPQIKGEYSLLISGSFPKDSLLVIRVEQAITKIGNKIDLKDSAFSLLNNHDGNFHTSILLNDSTSECGVTVTYNDSKFIKSLKKVVSLKIRKKD